MNIPIELFAMFIGGAFGIVSIGLAKQQVAGVSCAIGGMIIIVVALLTDVILLGIIPIESITVGDTTTYDYIDNTFTFTEWHKILMMIVGAFVMILGAVISQSDKK